MNVSLRWRLMLREEMMLEGINPQATSASWRPDLIGERSRLIKINASNERKELFRVPVLWRDPYCGKTPSSYLFFSSKLGVENGIGTAYSRTPL